jgi:Nuclear condensing complex subunits, C-term domain
VIIFLCINDVNENVKKSAYELIAKSIDLFGYVYFFERIGIDNNNLIEIMKLKIQSDEIENMKIHDWFLDQVRSGGLLEIIILRLSCESMRKNNKELKITLEEVTELIQNHKSDNILLYNLLMISKCFDFFVPETRTCLLNVLGPICKEIKVRDYKDTLNLDMSKDSSIQGEDIIEGIVLIIREMFRFQENEYSRILKQMIDEVLEPGNSSYQKSRIQYEKTLNTHISLKQEHSVLKYESIKVNDGEETSNTLIKIEELEKMIYKYEGKLQKKSKKMYYRYYRALVICCYALKNAKILELNEEFCGLIDDLILPSYSYSHTNIKLLSLECLGYYCLLSSQAVRIYFSRFISELENRSELEICALKFMFDFYITNNLLDNTEFIKGIVVLSRYLNTQNTFILHFVIVGFCKIVLLDKLPKSVGILTKLIILYFTESKYCMDIIYKFLEILASTDQKKCFTVLKALKIYLSLKKNEKKLAFPVETSGKRIKSLVSMLETIYTNYTSKNLQFSLVFFFTKLFIGEYITQKSYEECVLDYNWSSFTSEDLVIIKDIIDSRKLKPKSMPKIISRAIKDKEILIDFPLSYYTYEKEHSKVLRLSSRFYNALSNYSEIGIFMCDRFEDVVLDGLPTKRSRQQSKSHEFISLD